MIFFIVLMYGQEQTISSKRTNKSSPILLLMTSGLYGCRKPSWPTCRTGKPALLEEMEISMQLPKARCSCHTRPMKASRSLFTPTWSNQIPPFCRVWICVYRKFHARCDRGLKGTKGPREEDQKTHLPNHLATMISPLQLRGIFPRIKGNTRGRFGTAKWYTVRSQLRKEKNKLMKHYMN